jgi:hypothetical protein
MKKFKSIIDQAKALTIFIYSHLRTVFDEEVYKEETLLG